MGWFIEGSEHESYVVCVFADGMCGSRGRYMEINLMTPDGRSVEHEPGYDAWRPPSQVVGWRIACRCVPFREHVILDPLWTRVWDPADEDVAAGRIYTGPPASADAADIGDREDLEPLFLDVWHRHIAQDLEARLDDAVAAARSAGVSWEKIGKPSGSAARKLRSAGKQPRQQRQLSRAEQQSIRERRCQNSSRKPGPGQEDAQA